MRLFWIVLFLTPFRVFATNVEFSVDGSGNSVVVWESINLATKKTNIKGGYFAAGSTTPTFVTTLSTTTINCYKPIVSVNTSGSAAVAWIAEDTSRGVGTVQYAFFDSTNGWSTVNTLTPSTETVLRVSRIQVYPAILIPASVPIVLIWDTMIVSTGVIESHYSFGNFSTKSYGAINVIP